jgi:hypothetical protein
MRSAWFVVSALLVGCASERPHPSPPAAAPLAAAVAAAPAGTADEGAAEETTDFTASFPRAFATVDALCADYLESVAGRRAQLEESARFADVPLGRPSCRTSPKRLGVAFSADPMYQRAFFLERSDGLEKELRVVVQMPRGLVPTAIAWDTVDPTDPGCPSIPRTTGLAALRVENGYLVATLAQEVITYDDSGNTRAVPLLDATWCGDRSGALACRTYDSMNQPRLGRFQITADGALAMR